MKRVLSFPRTRESIHHGLLWIFAFAGMTLLFPSPVHAERGAQDLVETLREDDEATAKAAEEMLVKMGPDAVRPLEKALSDPNFRVRRRAAEALAGLGPAAKRAAPELVLLLADPQFEVHAAVENALLSMGDDAIPALSKGLKSDSEGLRKIALSTLARFGPKGTPILLNLLKKDDSVFIRASAAEALGEMPTAPAEVIQGLVQAFSDLEEAVRSAAADSLGQQGASAKAAIGPLLAAAQSDKDPLTRKRASVALSRIGPATKDSLAGLIAGLRDPSVEVRREIIEVMGKSSIPFADALPALTSALKDPDPGVRLEVVHVNVALSGTRAAALALLKQAAGDSDVEVRAAAIDGLGRLKDSAAQAASELEPLHADPNPVIRQDAIRALGNLGAAGAPGLIQALGDSYGVLSDEAGKAIVKSGADAIPALEAAKAGPDPVLKKKAIALIKRIQQRTRRSKK